MVSKRKSVIYRYIIFGFGIVMLSFCLIVGVWTADKAQQTGRRMMDEENLLLVRTLENVESNMQNLETISNQIVTDKQITPYWLRSGGYHTVEAINKLKYYCHGMEFFKDLMICLNNDDEIYRTAGKERFTTLSQHSFSIGGSLTADSLCRHMDSREQYGFLSISEQLTWDKNPENMITYPLYSSDGSNFGTLIGLIDMDFFENAVMSGANLASSTVICNRQGDLLLVTSGESISGISLADFLDGFSPQEKYYGIMGNNEKYKAIAYRAETTDWYYIRFIRQRDLSAVIRKELLPFAGVLLILSLISAAVIGVLIAFYYYLPVNSLLRLFDPNTSYIAKKNELSMIEQHIMNLQKESQSIRQQLDARNKQQIREVLTEVLYGGGVNDTETELFEEYGYTEQDFEYCVILLMPQQGYQDTDRERWLEKISEAGLLFITYDIYGGYVCLYQNKKGAQSAMKRSNELYESFQNEGYNVRIAVGGYSENLGALRNSLNESLLAAELDKDNAVVSLDSSYSGSIQEFWQPCREELLLELAVRTGSLDEIIKCSKELETVLCNVARYYRNNEIQYVFYRIMNYMIISLPTSGADEEVIKQLQIMRDAKEVGEFFTHFRDCAKKVFAIDTHDAGKIKNSRVKEFKIFIDDNMQLPEMSLGFVADHFGIRPSYLSKLFKENTGENFIDYLSRLRLEEAAQLLRETDKTVNQIVNEVGYEDATSFAKKFAKKYGVTPGVYKKQFCTIKQ